MYYHKYIRLFYLIFKGDLTANLRNFPFQQHVYNFL